MGGGTDIGVSVRAGVVVEDESDFAFAHRFFCKGDPFFHPDGNFPATVRERLAGFFAIRTTAAGTDIDRLDYTFELRHRNRPAGIKREPGRFAPLFERFVQGDDGGEDRDAGPGEEAGPSRGGRFPVVALFGRGPSRNGMSLTMASTSGHPSGRDILPPRGPCLLRRACRRGSRT